MNIIKTDKDYSKYFNNISLKVVESHVNKICKYGQGAKACKYLSATPFAGFICVKNTPLKSVIDEYSKRTEWKAKGDNCDGFTMEE